MDLSVDCSRPPFAKTTYHTLSFTKKMVGPQMMITKDRLRVFDRVFWTKGESLTKNGGEFGWKDGSWAKNGALWKFLAAKGK